jgi:hypothetical protein
MYGFQKIGLATGLLVTILSVSPTSAECINRGSSIECYGTLDSPNLPSHQNSGPASCPVKTELLANFKWIHDDAGHNQKSAAMQGNILRASDGASAALKYETDQIRKAYKEAQSHNPKVAALIDRCDDLGVDAVAYEFAEKYVRLSTCSDPPPARSATCSDFTENMRWALLDAGRCSPFARSDVDVWSDANDVRYRASFIRRGFKIAQGHARSTALSIDFISDPLLVRLAHDVWQKYRVADLPQSDGIPPDSSVCPGILLLDFYENG